MDFEWDNDKNRSNQLKHNISFLEAASVFGDPLAVTFHDPEHSNEEYRWLTFGSTRTEKLVVVSHTLRNEKMRIISARLMDKSERKIYEEG